jgi:hypothetical protein
MAGAAACSARAEAAAAMRTPSGPGTTGTGRRSPPLQPPASRGQPPPPRLACARISHLQLRLSQHCRHRCEYARAHWHAGGEGWRRMQGIMMVDWGLAGSVECACPPSRGRTTLRWVSPRRRAALRTRLQRRGCLCRPGATRQRDRQPPESQTRRLQVQTA